MRWLQRGMYAELLERFRRRGTDRADLTLAQVFEHGFFDAFLTRDTGEVRHLDRSREQHDVERSRAQAPCRLAQRFDIIGEVPLVDAHARDFGAARTQSV